MPMTAEEVVTALRWILRLRPMSEQEQLNREIQRLIYERQADEEQLAKEPTMPTVAAEITRLVWRMLELYDLPEDQRARLGARYITRQTFENRIQAALETGDYPRLRGEKQELKHWCVRHRDGWCATATGQPVAEGASGTQTYCGSYVSLPFGCNYQAPTCPQCTKRLSGEKR